MEADVFEILKQDHDNVSRLFDQLEASFDDAEREALFIQVRDLLYTHIELEESVLYSMLKDIGETRDMMFNSYDEHKVVKTLLDELVVLERDSPDWDDRFLLLREKVEQHVYEEEGEVFETARDVLSEDQIQALTTQLRTRKVRAASSGR